MLLVTDLRGPTTGGTLDLQTVRFLRVDGLEGTSREVNWIVLKRMM